MAGSRQRVISFKADPELAAALGGVRNRSEFIRSALLAALDSSCPLCAGTGISSSASAASGTRSPAATRSSSAAAATSACSRARASPPSTAAGTEMAAAARTSRFALAAWRRASPAALFVVVLGAAAVAVELGAGDDPPVEVVIDATGPVAWQVDIDGRRQGNERAEPTRWRGAAASPSARLRVEEVPAPSAAPGATVALRIAVRHGTHGNETVVWGGQVDIALGELLHGDAP